MKSNYLKNWWIERVSTGDVVIKGEIYNDSKERFEDGALIRTSSVRNIDFIQGVVETRNSIYNLEVNNGTRRN